MVIVGLINFMILVWVQIATPLDRELDSHAIQKIQDSPEIAREETLIETVTGQNLPS